MKKPNKTEQIARFMVEHGRFMTSSDVYNAGFRFEYGAETSPNSISALLNKMHVSGRYVVERNYIHEGNKRMVRVKVLRIIDSKYGDGPNKEINISHSAMWRKMLCGKRIEA
ncbi:MAG: hypothetical protein ACRC9H_08940 [Aeromonas veronii]